LKREPEDYEEAAREVKDNASEGADRQGDEEETEQSERSEK